MITIQSIAMVDMIVSPFVPFIEYQILRTFDPYIQAETVFICFFERLSIHPKCDPVVLPCKIIFSLRHKSTIGPTGKYGMTTEVNLENGSGAGLSIHLDQ